MDGWKEVALFLEIRNLAGDWNDHMDWGSKQVLHATENFIRRFPSAPTPVPALTLT